MPQSEENLMVWGIISTIDKKKCGITQNELILVKKFDLRGASFI